MYEKKKSDKSRKLKVKLKAYIKIKIIKKSHFNCLLTNSTTNLAEKQNKGTRNQLSNEFAATLKMTRCIRAGYSTVLPDLISIMENPVSWTSFKVD